MRVRFWCCIITMMINYAQLPTNKRSRTGAFRQMDSGGNAWRPCLLLCVCVRAVRNDVVNNNINDLRSDRRMCAAFTFGFVYTRTPQTAGDAAATAAGHPSNNRTFYRNQHFGYLNKRRFQHRNGEWRE